MVRTQAGFAVCLYGVSPRIPVHSSSWAGLLASPECLGIGGLPHVAGVRRENVGYRIYTAQGNLERINDREVRSVDRPISPSEFWFKGRETGVLLHHGGLFCVQRERCCCRSVDKSRAEKGH